MSTGTHVVVCEVGPRDGLQNEASVLTPAERIGFIDALSACGYERIEAVSFVSATRVPQMADAETVMAGILRRPGTAYTGLALNTRGAERAITAGVDRINFAFGVTDTLNRKNQGVPTADSIQALGHVVELAVGAGLPCTATLGVSFGCPFEGPVPVGRVADVAAAVADAGAQEIVLADTIGVGVPTQVTALVEAVRSRVGEVPLGFHFHDTRNTGLANVLAAVLAGVRLFDASAGGAGGCPFAPGAAGNVATEDLLYLLHGMGFSTTVDLPGLLPTARWLEDRLGHPLAGMVKRAGLDWHRATEA